MWKFYVYWREWEFSRRTRLNGSLYWGFNPYISYRIGPFEFRRYAASEEK